jgi:hypothetical protein
VCVRACGLSIFLRANYMTIMLSWDEKMYGLTFQFPFFFSIIRVYINIQKINIRLYFQSG